MGKVLTAHRFSFELHKGPIPKGFSVCHSCDNPRCVNPDHLFLGTQRDNALDMITKQRQRLPEIKSGEAHNMSILKESEVREIRQLRDSGQSHNAIAKRFGVSRPTITAIFNGRLWRHLA
jgi:DNA-binding XRE family transcriptional regulator